MKRNIRIVSGCCVAASLLLIVASCATTPRREITLESARRSLQIDYPRVLESFDLHQGYFIVVKEAWDTLPAPDRIAFLQRCSQSRRSVVGPTAVTVRGEDGLLATYDGNAPVFYSGPYLMVGTSESIGNPEEVGKPPAAGSPVAVATSPAGTLSGETSWGPALVVIPRPVYPKAALDAGIEGTVLVKVLVGEDGRVRDMAVVGDGIPALNGAAVAAASEARFQPAVEDGHSIAAWIQIPLRFSILGNRERTPKQRNEPRAVGLSASDPKQPPDLPVMPGTGYAKN